jgi:hypothetical protein
MVMAMGVGHRVLHGVLVSTIRAAVVIVVVSVGRRRR